MHISPEQKDFLSQLNSKEFSCVLYDLILNESFHTGSHRMAAIFTKALQLAITPLMMAQFTK